MTRAQYMLLPKQKNKLTKIVYTAIFCFQSRDCISAYVFLCCFFFLNDRLGDGEKAIKVLPAEVKLPKLQA